jgi:fatty acid synthase
VNDGKYSSQCHELFHNDFKNGIIKPLKTNVFKRNELEKAFRFLAGGKHVGKILINVKEQETESEDEQSMSITPQINFNRAHSHILVGGLGGFGMELADWLVQRGVKILVMNSRTGTVSPYQAHKIK